MRRDKQQALALRLRGYSYNEINRLLGTPKSTLSGWFTGLALSQNALSRIQKRVREGSLRGLVRRNKLQTHLATQRARAIRRKAADEITEISRQELKMLGAALYWCEGYKRQIKNKTYHPVSLSNADPDIIRLFLKFLREICMVPNERIRVSVRIFPHVNEQKALQYWAYTTGIPLNQFHKTYYGISIASKHKRPFNRLPHGTVRVQVGDTGLFYRIMGWIGGISKFQ